MSEYEIMQGHVNEEPQSLRELNPEVDAHTEAVVLRALAKDPNDRYGGCKAMQLALLDKQHDSSDDDVDQEISNQLNVLNWLLNEEQEKKDDPDLHDWLNACKANTYDAYEAYAIAYPKGKYYDVAVERYRQGKPFFKKDSFGK